MNAVAPLQFAADAPAQDRRHFIGGSDAGAILGLSKWRTRYECWLEKTGDPIPEDPKKSKVFKRGKTLEPYVLQMLLDEKGIKATSVNQRFVDPEHPFLACEVDAVTDDDEDIEIKTVHPFAAKEWGEEETDEIPPVYTAQALHGLAITKKRSRLVAALIGADDLRLYRVEWHDETITGLRQAELDFWQLVKSRTVPGDLTIADLNRIYGVDSGQVVECTDLAVIDALAAVKDLKEQAKEIEARIEYHAAIVKGFLKDRAVMTIGNKKACSWKTQYAERIDITSLRAKRPDIAEQFTVKTPSRVFRT